MTETAATEGMLEFECVDGNQIIYRAPDGTDPRYHITEVRAGHGLVDVLGKPRRIRIQIGPEGAPPATSTEAINVITTLKAVLAEIGRSGGAPARLTKAADDAQRALDNYDEVVRV